MNRNDRFNDLLARFDSLPLALRRSGRGANFKYAIFRMNDLTAAAEILDLLMVEGDPKN